MPRLSFRLAGLAVTIAAIAASSSAVAQSGHRRWPHETRAERREFRSHRHGTVIGGGPADSIYPHYYDAARSYYGGRGDSRWRWTETGRPGYYGAPFMGPYGYYPWFGY